MEACNGDESLPGDVERDKAHERVGCVWPERHPGVLRRENVSSRTAHVVGGRTTFVTWIVAGGDARTACRTWAAALFSRPSLCRSYRDGR